MHSLSSVGTRWRLADLIDLEVLLSSGEAAIDTRDRRAYTDNIAPRLSGLSEARRRRVGLRLWLAMRREQDGGDWPGTAWDVLMGWMRSGLTLLMAALGAMMVWGLCLGSDQRVHVVIFLGLTLALPWLAFIAVLLFGWLRRNRAHPPWLIGMLVRLLTRRLPGVAERWRFALSETRATRGAVAARAGRLSQWAGLGYVGGAITAFLAALMLFDVRFYWEATPDDALLVHAMVAWVSSPWQALWPAAVPGPEAIAASRLAGAGAGLPPGGAVAGAWWRFLLMALITWSVVPRLVLLGVFVLRERLALAGLDFQAPRHRSAWRGLAGVSRGAVAQAATDSALVLDVGGHGIDGAAVRGFLLRRLRLAPARTVQVSVLDDAAEQSADAALAAEPGHVVLLVADWLLSPRQTQRLHQRVRASVGDGVPVIWLVLGDDNGRPTAPDSTHLAQWTTFIDGLRDPATEIAAYDPTA